MHSEAEAIYDDGYRFWPTGAARPRLNQRFRLRNWFAATAIKPAPELAPAAE